MLVSTTFILAQLKNCNYFRFKRRNKFNLLFDSIGVMNECIAINAYAVITTQGATQ